MLFGETRAGGAVLCDPILHFGSLDIMILDPSTSNMEALDP